MNNHSTHKRRSFRQMQSKLLLVFDKHPTIKHISQLLSVVIVSIIQYYQLQYSTSRNFSGLSFVVILGNISLCLAILIVFSFIFRKRHIVILVAGFFTTIWSIVNYYVTRFHGGPILLSELVNLKTALGVANNYHYEFNYIILKIILLGLLQIGIALFVKFFLQANKRLSTKVRVLYLSISIVLACISALIYINTDVSFGIHADEGVKKYGYYYTLIKDVENRINPINEPIGYDVDTIKNITAKNNEANNIDPDIIFILNESFFDLSICCNIQYDTDYLADYYNLENARYGYAEVSLTGGGTNNSEFELLTSHSMYLLRNMAPFNYINFKKSDFSAVEYLNRLGYTTVAMHCGEKTSYSRNIAYPYMGFDRIITGGDNFTQSCYGNRSWLDSDNYTNLLEEYERCGNGPRFVYMLTYQNHGGYEQNPGDLDTVHTLTDFGDLTDDVNEYLSSVSLSAQAFVELTDHLSDSDRKVIICMVGDHAPSFITSISDNNRPNISFYERAVPYVIWSNFVIDENSPDFATITDLVPMVFSYSEIPLSPYYSYIIELSKEIPIRSSSGEYIDNSGNVGLFGKNDPRFDLLSKYYYMEFNALKHSSDYLEYLFFLGESN